MPTSSTLGKCLCGGVCLSCQSLTERGLEVGVLREVSGIFLSHPHRKICVFTSTVYSSPLLEEIGGGGGGRSQGFAISFDIVPK